MNLACPLKARHINLVHKSHCNLKLHLPPPLSPSLQPDVPSAPPLSPSLQPEAPSAPPLSPISATPCTPNRLNSTNNIGISPNIQNRIDTLLQAARMNNQPTNNSQSPPPRTNFMPYNLRPR